VVHLKLARRRRIEVAAFAHCSNFTSNAQANGKIEARFLKISALQQL